MSLEKRNLEVVHGVGAHYAHYYKKYAGSESLKIDVINVDATPPEELIDIVDSYGSIHFWVEVPADLLRTIRRKAPRTLITITNAFGEPLPGLEDEPWDAQVHVTKTAFAKYCTLRGGTPEQLFPRNVTIYLPVDTEVFRKDAYRQSETEALKSRLGIGSEEVVLSRTGRPDVWKWDLFPVHLLQRLRELGVRFRFLAVGGIPDFVERELRRRSLSKYVTPVPFERYNPGVDVRSARLLAASDFYVHSAFIGESCGLSIIEAMSMEKPVLVTNKPWADNAPPEYIENGINGFLCPDVETSARLVRSLSRDDAKRREVGRRARERVVPMFGAAASLRNYERMVASPKAEWGNVLDPSLQALSAWYEDTRAAAASRGSVRRANWLLFRTGVVFRRTGKLGPMPALSSIVRRIPKPAALRDLELVL